MAWVGRTWWELKLSRGWRHKDDEECLSLTKCDEGAFQLSAAVKSSGQLVTVDELREFYGSEVSEGEQLREVEFGAFRGLTTRAVEHGTLWQKFWLAHGNLMIFATYNGTEQAWAKEQQDVHAMLSTLRVRSGAKERAS
jgi:hypothetical protein